MARNYLAQAQVFRNSVAEVHPEIEFTTLLVDGTEADRTIPDLGRVILLSDLGIDPDVLDIKKTIYDVMEFSVSLKPTLLAFLLAEGAEVAAYFDPDIFVYSRLDDLFAKTFESGISITPHAVTPFPTDDRLVTERLLMWAGIYNAGFMAVSAAGSPVVQWWEDRLKTHGIADPENALYADQRWVDWVPALADPHIERGLGFNVAHWNLHERPITLGDSGPLAGGETLRFLHFSGYDPAKPWLLSTHTAANPRILLSENPGLQVLSDAYGARLIEAGHPELRKSAYGFGVLPNGFRLSLEIRRFVRLVLIGEVVGATMPPSAFERPAEFESWMLLRQFGSRIAPLSALELAFWYGRSDLATAFPDPIGKGASAYRRWFEDDSSAQAWLDEISPTLRPARAENEPVSDGRFLPGSWAVVSSATTGSEQREPARALADALHTTGRDVRLVDESRYSTGDAVTGSLFSALERSEDVNVVTVFTASSTPSHDIRTATSGNHIAFVSSSPAQISSALLQELTSYDQVWASSAWTATWLHQLRRFPVRRVVLPAPDGGVDYVASTELRFRIAVDADNPGWRTSLDDAVVAYVAAFPEPADATLQIEDRGIAVEAREQISLLSSTRPDVVLVERDAPYAAGTILLLLEPTQGIGANVASAIAAGVPVIAADHPGCTEFLANGDSAGLVAVLTLGGEHDIAREWPGCDRLALSAAMRLETGEVPGSGQRAMAASDKLRGRRFAVGSPNLSDIIAPNHGWVVAGDPARDDELMARAIDTVGALNDLNIFAVSDAPTLDVAQPGAISVKPFFGRNAVATEDELDDRLNRLIKAGNGQDDALQLGDLDWDLIREVLASEAVLILGARDATAPSIAAIYEWAALSSIAAEHGIPVVLSGNFFAPESSPRQSQLLGALLSSAQLVGTPDVAAAHAAAALGAPVKRLYRVADDQMVEWWNVVVTTIAPPRPRATDPDFGSESRSAIFDPDTSTERDIPMTSDRSPAPLLDEYAAQIEVLEQALFERERYAASVARALSEATRRVHETTAELAATQASAEHRVSQAEAEKIRVIADLKNSTSWKVSLPVRVLRHPVRYARIVLGR